MIFSKPMIYGMLVLAVISVGGVIYHQIREGGKEAQRTEQRKVDDAARTRIKAVPTPDARSTGERLRAGSF